MKAVCGLVALLMIPGPLCGMDNSLSEREAQDGWILLFDGGSLFGWSPQGGAQWRVAKGELLAETGDSGYLRSNSAFADFILRCDFRIRANGESGIFLRIDKEGQPQETGYKLQINNNDTAFPTGSLANELKASGVQAMPNQWHTYEVEARGERFTVKLDGKQAVSGEAHKTKVGHIGLQFVSGTPVEFRNIKLRPLGLGLIFNGQNLYGWKVVNPPPEPKKKGLFGKLKGGGPKPPEWSVEDGALHIDKGSSQLETNAVYDDFILQLNIRVDSRNKKEHPTGGVFLRAEKGTASTGYKEEISNDYQGDDRSRPVGYGTGGLDSLRAARKVVSNDNEFFTETIAARGHHIAVWVNGYSVSDYEDSRAEGPDALIQARTVPGTISLEAHDPASSLDFRNIQIASLTKGGAAITAGVAAPGAPGAAPAPGAAAPGVTPPAAPTFPTPIAPAGNPHEKEISELTQRALRSNDPAEQVKLYDKILEFDPSNMVAFNGRKDAQDKIDKMNAEKAQQEAEKARQEEAKQQQQEQAQSTEANKREAVKQAEAAFLANNLPLAATQIAIAKKIDPNDPEVQRVDSLIQSKIQARRRRQLTAYVIGALALVALILLVVLRLRKKDAYLEIVDGFDKGKRYNVDQDVIHIGAVAQDGGNKNEIVVQDVERTVSRFHCEVHRHNGKLYVLDCESANGTYLDGRRVRPGKPARLKKGARLQLAEACTLRLGFEKRKAEKS
jgi:hypothetical protein